MSLSETILREADFRERRARVLRATGAFAMASAGGIGLVLLAKVFRPEVFDAAVLAFLVGMAVTGLALIRRVRRDWRCPACDVRWDGRDALAAGLWNHCAACGAELRAAPRESERERLAETEFALAHLSHAELVARFRRRRRLGLLAAGVLVVASIAVHGVMRARGFGKVADPVFVAVATGLVAAGVLLTTRCPRCRTGMLGTERSHCQRCGFSLAEPDDRGSDDPR